jgi:orotate phosphoribosyltransferase
MNEKKETLLDLLREKSFRERRNPPFDLASGGTSPYYVDCKPTTNSALGMALIGEIIFEEVKDLEVTAIGGLTMGADPIAHAVALTSCLRGNPIDAFCVRKKAKDHGIVRLIEGDVKKGDRVAIVDDVITTGGSTIQAIQTAREFGLEIVKVIVLVDRQEKNGSENIRRAAPEAKLVSIFTLSEIAGRDVHEETHPEGSVRGEPPGTHPVL